MRSICSAGSFRLIAQSLAASKSTTPATPTGGPAAETAEQRSIFDPSMWHWHAANDFLDDLVRRHAFDLGARFQRHAMAQRGTDHGLNVLGQNETASLQACDGLCRAHHPESGAWRCADGNRRMLAGAAHERNCVVQDFLSWQRGIHYRTRF